MQAETELGVGCELSLAASGSRKPESRIVGKARGGRGFDVVAGRSIGHPTRIGHGVNGFEAVRPSPVCLRRFDVVGAAAAQCSQTRTS